MQSDTGPNAKSGADVAGESASPATAEGAQLPAPDGVLDSAKLFGGRKQLVIGHNGCHYVLRITRQGKLVLNK